MTIDLRTCKPGDKLEMRNSEVAEYVKSTGERPYPHSVKMPIGKDAFFTDNGQFYSYRTSSTDIVKVIPMPTDSTIPQRGAKEFTKYAIDVMMAHSLGEEVEVAHKKCLDFTLMVRPSWNWEACDYRIKPKPTVIPWTMETCPVGKVVRIDERRTVIMCAMTDSVYLHLNGTISYVTLLNKYTMDDGAPCGTVQQ